MSGKPDPFIPAQAREVGQSAVARGEPDRSTDHATAIDTHDGAGRERRRGEKQDRISDVLRLPDPTCG